MPPDRRSGKLRRRLHRSLHKKRYSPLHFPSGSQLMHKAHQSGLRLQFLLSRLLRIFRTQNRSHLMLSDEHAYTVCTCIASPRTDKHKPYGKHSSRKHSCKVNVRQHYRYIKYSEKCRHDLLCIIFRIRKYKHCHLADQIRHKKQHKPCMFFSREIFFHINKRIIPESKI